LEEAEIERALKVVQKKGGKLRQKKVRAALSYIFFLDIIMRTASGGTNRVRIHQWQR
jgi:hypothetical protein